MGFSPDDSLFSMTLSRRSPLAAAPVFAAILTLLSGPATAQPLATPPPPEALSDSTPGTPEAASEVLAWARRAADARRAAKAHRARTDVEARGGALLAAWSRAEALRLEADRAEAVRAEAERLATAHLFVPEGSEALVAAQAAVVRRRFGGVGRRGRQYFPMIERALRRRRLPADLKYVALIESALDPGATSPAGAAGLWQFMPETAADFGLDSLGVRDPARATDAAARYLERLGRAFNGDWQLALAAYNGGWGRVQRLVDDHRRRTGTAPTFWDIQHDLPAETRAYVPRFIAVAAHYGSRRGA